MAQGAMRLAVRIAAAKRLTPPAFARRGPGFTLLELMAVVAIVAILALMTLPSFVDTIIRNQILEALPLADIARKPIDASWAATQAFPADNAAIGLPKPDKVVSNQVTAMAVEDGVIHITFGNRANGLIKGKVLTLRPAVVEDAPVVPVAWVCGYANGPDKMTVRGANRTTVPQRYLPWKCRAG
jgi:type IV pilus assembly protein PilA